ncbi:hypothetical protein pipiens_015530 [Culex pipiens pipiens]|uniref:Uncharacterized protein n=1 Tax=Culex pipiens pipiens TaxID=38569 RepID=A0ABD1CQ21_CULPP
MYLVQEQRKVDQACRSTTAELLDTWERVHIPLQLKQNVVVVIRKLYDDWVKIKKNKQKELDRKKKFLAKLDTLLDISSRKAETTDDRAMEFLEDQRGRRQFGLAVMDGSASKRKSVVIEPEAETSVEPTDPDYVPEPKRVKIDHHIKSSEAKPNVLTEDVLSALDRNKVSDRQAFKIIMPVVAALDVDGSTMALSRSTITRRRQEARKEIADRAKAEFDPQGPLVVHWDGTKLENVGNSAHSERLPVLVSWSDGEKLLGAPAVSHSTGACVKLEQLMGRELMWLACRHHTHELILAKAFSVCFGPSTSPEIPLFKRFRDKWEDIPKERVAPLVVTKKWCALKDTVISYLKSANTFTRDDYKELLELTLVVLGETPEKFTFKKPGPIHHARWMAKMLYAIKIYLLREQGCLFELTREEVKQLKRFVRFGTLLYVKPWLQAPLGVDAATNDLNLWNSINDFRKTDPEIACAALAVLERHLWYLSDELVGFSLFSEKVSAEEKQRVVQAMKTIPAGERSVLGDPELLKTGRASLADFSTMPTASIFAKLSIDDTFTERPPTEWAEIEGFKAGLRVVQNLKVVNDIAERGVKLCEEYNKVFTKNEAENQRVLQVVELNRKAVKTDCTKAELLQKFH